MYRGMIYIGNDIVFMHLWMDGGKIGCFSLVIYINMVIIILVIIYIVKEYPIDTDVAIAETPASNPTPNKNPLQETPFHPPIPPPIPVHPLPTQHLTLPQHRTLPQIVHPRQHQTNNLQNQRLI